MNRDFNDIFNSVKNTSLTKNERILMRNNLSAFMAEHPARVPLHVRAPEAIFSWASITLGGRGVLRPLAAACAIVLVAGSGTAYAAEDALPGEALYSVKVHINERVEGAFVAKSEKAVWHAKRIARRLEEAEVLAARGTLSAKAQIDIETQIQASTQAFQKDVAVLAQSRDDGEIVAAAIQSDLEASLVGHERVLAMLSRSHGEKEVSVRPILATVRAHADAVESSREDAERTIAKAESKKPSKIKAAATQSRFGADLTIAEVRRKAALPPHNPTTESDVDRSAREVELAIQVGDEKLKQGYYTDAFERYQAALRAAKAVAINLDAEARFQTDLQSEGTATMMMSAEPTAIGAQATTSTSTEHMNESDDSQNQSR